MYLFVFAAGIMTAVHLVAGVQRPRPMVIVSGILWLLYAVYEYHVANGTLCDANCNIRVDLALFFPILGLATYGAYQSYMGRTRHQKVIGIILGVIVLFVLAFLAESFGYGDLAGVVFVCVLAAIGIYAIWSRLKTKRP